MLKIEEAERIFEVKTKTDRDGETVLLMEWLKETDSLLDIGAFYSYYYYTDRVRQLAKVYHGVDILPDPITEGMLDNYFVGNANEVKFKRTYDTVICVSTIEHAGIGTYKADIKTEQNNLFQKCLDLADKRAFISFPVGQAYAYPNELSVITDDQLAGWEKILKPYSYKQRFLYTQGAQAGHNWFEHTKRDVAVKIPYIDFIGNQSICVLEIEK